MKLSSPIFKIGGKGGPPAQPDPYILEDGGNYYIYATNPLGVALYASTNFLDWEYCGLCLEVEGQKEFWAPSVIKLDGRFYMHYSSMPTCSNDVHDQQIRVAVSDSPTGKFHYAADVLPPFSIDPHVVVHEGDLFMFYCQNDYEAERAGTGIYVDKMLDPFRTEGKPVAAVLPSIDEEIFERNRFRQGQHWHTVEGAFYLKHGDTHFLMYSGSAYTRPSYFIGYATAKGEETDLRKLCFTKHPDNHTYSPLLSQNALIEGAGHNSVISIDGNYYCVYHARDAVKPKTHHDSRTFRASPLIIEGDTMRIEI